MGAKLIKVNAREHLAKRRDYAQARITESSIVDDCDLPKDLIEYRQQMKQFVFWTTQVVNDAALWERIQKNPVKIESPQCTIGYMLGREISGKVFIFDNAFWNTSECFSDDDGERLVIEAAQKPIGKLEVWLARFRDDFVSIAVAPEVRPSIAIGTFLISLIVLITGAGFDAPWLTFSGGIGAVVGAFMIMREFAREGGYSSRRWGESVWQAAGRQGAGGRTGCGLIVSLTFVVA
jgi:hypothetical protein